MLGIAFATFTFYEQKPSRSPLFIVRCGATPAGGG